jgi:hypothetical protein
VAPRVEIRGFGLDEDFEGQRSYTITLRFRHQLDPGLRIELADLVEAWYLIGAHSGFRRYLNQLHDVEFDREANGESATFRVVGALTRQAVDVLVRCLTDSDLDVIAESVVVTVTEYE